VNVIGYEITFPFEVNQEEGTMYYLAPTLKDALRLARECCESVDPDYAQSGDVVIERCVVRPLTRPAVCEILNTRGSRWRESGVEVRRLPYVAPKREE
jgi:hypothetical protein